MNDVVVAVVNRSALRSGPFNKMFLSLAQQIEGDYNSSAWVKLGLAPKATLVSGEVPGAWVLAIEPHGNGELGEGWHEWDEARGVAVGFVNYAVTHQTPGMTSMIASHELLEMLVDPTDAATVTNVETGVTYKLEVCDPVYGDTYEVLGLPVSDFCEPAWFGIADGLSFPWFTCKKGVAAAGALGPNGYIEVECPAEPGVWNSITAGSPDPCAA